MENREYVQVLLESLKKKYRILLQIEKSNKRQNEVMLKEEIDFEAWEKTVDEKAALIDELERLDSGFDSVYAHVKEEFLVNKEAFKQEISGMQTLISDITAKSIDIQAQEKRNSELATRAFSKMKQRNRNIIQSNRVANIYDTNMKKLNVIDAQFINLKH